MSVVISDMKLPESCKDCDLLKFNYDWFCCAVSKDGQLLDLENLKDEFIYTDKRHPECQLTALPEKHGRLIDADALLENIKQMQDDCVYDAEVYAFQRVAEAIMHSPTLMKGKNHD